MKKFLMMAALAAFIAAPAMAEDKSSAEKEAKMNEWFAQADTDGNGTISKDEFTADAGKKFDEADTNDDGQLTKEEKMAWKKDKKG